VVLLLICRPFHLRLPDPFTPRIRTALGKGVGWHRPPSDGLQWTRKLCNNQQSQVARITRILFHKVIVLPSCSIGTMKECITDRLTASRAGTLEGFLLSYLIITRSLITNVPKNQIRLLYACTRLLLVVLLLKAYTGSCQRISSPWNMIVGALWRTPPVFLMFNSLSLSIVPICFNTVTLLFPSLEILNCNAIAIQIYFGMFDLGFFDCFSCSRYRHFIWCPARLYTSQPGPPEWLRQRDAGPCQRCHTWT